MIYAYNLLSNISFPNPNKFSNILKGDRIFLLTMWSNSECLPHKVGGTRSLSRLYSKEDLMWNYKRSWHVRLWIYPWMSSSLWPSRSIIWCATFLTHTDLCLPAMNNPRHALTLLNWCRLLQLAFPLRKEIGISGRTCSITAEKRITVMPSAHTRSRKSLQIIIV